jgi:dihydrofolate reductase
VENGFLRKLPMTAGTRDKRGQYNCTSKKEQPMSKVRVAAFSVSLDGFGAGPRQDLNNPLGVRGFELHGWFQGTEVFTKMHGQSGGTQGIDNDFAAQSFENVGAWILGRNMFGPVRGSWKDDSWKGWWGDNPPYHTPVFVLTHHARSPLTMEGGTTFHFVTDGLEAALTRAKEAAKGKDVRIGGGVSVIRQYLIADQIDEMHLAVSPVLLGEGEHLFSGINLCELGFTPLRTVSGENAMHVLIRKRSS